MRDDHSLVSPEAVPLDLPEATVGSRAPALLVDWILQAIIGLVLGLAAESAVDTPGLPTWVAPTTAIVLTFLVYLGYPIGFETAWSGGGRTPGKALLGLRVVTVEGAPIRFRHAAIRAALGLVDFAATFGIAAVLASLLSRRNQRLGDMVAGTVVLRERTGSERVEARDFVVPEPLRGVADALDTSALGPREYAAVRTYLLRADALPDDRAAQIGEELLTALAPRLGDVPRGPHPRLVLQAVAARYQQRRRAGDGSAPG